MRLLLLLLLAAAAATTTDIPETLRVVHVGGASVNEESMIEERFFRGRARRLALSSQA